MPIQHAQVYCLAICSLQKKSKIILHNHWLTDNGNDKNFNNVEK